LWKVFGHKKSEKSTRIFLNTDFGRENNPLTGNTYIYQQNKFSKSVAPELQTPQQFDVKIMEACAKEIILKKYIY
jgi:hypothetical protein